MSIDPRKMFKELPEINPKTHEKVKFFVCIRCGCPVVSRKSHIHWHQDTDKKILESNPYYTDWPPVDG